MRKFVYFSTHYYTRSPEWMNGYSVRSSSCCQCFGFEKIYIDSIAAFVQSK